MKEYRYKEKNQIIHNKRYNVIIPDKHSTIEGLILETKDLNAWDDWANITDFHTLCLILKKGKKEWETIYNGSTNLFEVNGIKINSLGIFNILFYLENKKVRNNFFRKKEIKELKSRIKRDSHRLHKLQEGKNG